MTVLAIDSIQSDRHNGHMPIRTTSYRTRTIYAKAGRTPLGISSVVELENTPGYHPHAHRDLVATLDKATVLVAWILMEITDEDGTRVAMSCSSDLVTWSPWTVNSDNEPGTWKTVPADDIQEDDDQ